MTATEISYLLTFSAGVLIGGVAMWHLGERVQRWRDGRAGLKLATHEMFGREHDE